LIALVVGFQIRIVGIDSECGCAIQRGLNLKITLKKNLSINKPTFAINKYFYKALSANHNCMLIVSIQSKFKLFSRILIFAKLFLQDLLITFKLTHKIIYWNKILNWIFHICRKYQREILAIVNKDRRVHPQTGSRNQVIIWKEFYQGYSVLVDSLYYPISVQRFAIPNMQGWQVSHFSSTNQLTRFCFSYWNYFLVVLQIVNLLVTRRKVNNHNIGSKI